MEDELQSVPGHLSVQNQDSSGRQSGLVSARPGFVGRVSAGDDATGADDLVTVASEAATTTDASGENMRDSVVGNNGLDLRRATGGAPIDDDVQAQSVHSLPSSNPFQRHQIHHTIPLTDPAALADRRRRLEKLAAAHPPHLRKSHWVTGHHPTRPGELCSDNIHQGRRLPEAYEMEISGDQTTGTNHMIFDFDEISTGSDQASILSENNEVKPDSEEEELEDATLGGASAPATWNSAKSSGNATVQSEDSASLAHVVQHRSHFTLEQKRAVINAYLRGGRKDAIATGAVQTPVMQPRTVDSLVARFKKLERDGQNPFTACSDRRVNNKGKSSKWDEKYHTELILCLLHDNPTYTLEEMRSGLNTELARRKLNEFITDHGNDVLQMTKEEQEMFHPLSEERMQALLDLAPIVKEWYKRAKVSQTTISRHLRKRPICFTRKIAKTEKSSVNTKAGMKARFIFAKKLMSLINHPEGNELIFIDEMSFYLAMHRRHGWAKSGDRAVVKVPPISNFAYRTQVAVAVHPREGLIYGDCYLPKKMNVIRAKDGELSQRSVLKAAYTRDEFRNFMSGLFRRLMEKNCNWESGSYKDLIKGKRVFLVMNNAPEHTAGVSTPDADDILLRSIENFAPLNDFITENGGSISFLRISPNSPHLNLCKYYNRVLRTFAQHERNDTLITSLLLAEKVPHGEKATRRLGALEIIIEKGFERIYSSKPLFGELSVLVASLQKVIDQDGFLNYQTRN